MINHYLILGIDMNATEAEIKSAFKKKAVVYHPDKNPGNQESEEMFKLVNAAYQVLSNPYERARFDLKLKFGEAELVQSPPPAYRPPMRRPGYPGGGGIDHETNDKATLWAFGISLAIAALVMTIMQGVNMYQKYKRDIMLGERWALFEEARNKHSEGAVSASLNILETLGFFLEEEEEIKAFQEDVLAELLHNGTEKFYRNQYREAIRDFQIYENYAPNLRLSFETLFAEAHMKAGNHDEAISRFNSIIIQGNNTIENSLKIAHIYLDGKKEYEQAMNYFEIASEMAINGYKSIYGEAYPLLLSAKTIPPSHFNIFHGMARAFFYQENYERALNAIKWNAAMWPDHPENYMLRGEIFKARGQTRQACREFQKAIEMGWDKPINC